MTRTIKASEVKPGMEVEFALTCRMEIHKNTMWGNHHRELTDYTGSAAFVDEDTPVTVLSEPASAQPEEPTEFGAKVIVDGRRFIRADDYVRPWLESEVWTWYTWAHLCEMGPVTVVPDQGWTVPDSPEVPDWIDEWPEDDRALRAFMWRDRYRCVWMWNAGYSKWECHNAAGDYMRTIVRPVCGPWERITDGWASTPR